MSNQQAPPLLPCPFDGGTARIMQVSGTYWVRCNSCGADYGYTTTEERSIAAWNRRAPEPQAPARIFKPGDTVWVPGVVENIYDQLVGVVVGPADVLEPEVRTYSPDNLRHREIEK